MAICVVDGLEIDGDPTWAVYAWDAFQGMPLEAMPMHQSCFESGEWIEASWWENDENNNPVLRSEQQLRLIQVPGTGYWQRTVDSETEEVLWMQVTMRHAVRLTDG